jgi:hypothetical protein
MDIYYLEGYQWLTVPFSRSAPRQDFPMEPLQTKRNAEIEGVSAAHRDAKPGAERVEVQNTAQSPADKPIAETCVDLKALRCYTSAHVHKNCTYVLEFSLQDGYYEDI